jgi:hypothetical protein
MLLAAFEIPRDVLQLFLRGDRDADSDEVPPEAGSGRTRTR